MKYSLAFDTKDYDSKNRRYIVIPNYLIARNLDVNNNLKALCNFTWRFTNEKELKETIIRLLPTFKECSEFRLVLMWSREVSGEKTIFTNSVLYSNASKYFDIDYLADVMTSRLQNKEFLAKFFEQYKDHGYLSKHLDFLYNAIMSNDIQQIKKAVNTFLNRLLFGKTGLEYAKLYKLVASILDMSSCSQEILADGSCDNIEFLEHSSLSETEEFELDWLKHRARLREKNGGYY